MMTLAQAIGAFVANLRFDSIPEAAVGLAKSGLIDCLAVTVAGSREPPIERLCATLRRERSHPEATLYFGRERMSAANAAWINGAAGHVLDYDDFARGHPSVVIVPAILAEAEVLNASGADMLCAYVAGYETWMELVTRERGNYQMKGWHPTPLLGALAAAAACANLRRLRSDEAASALGLAAAQASGITASYGTMAKSMQVGKAAHVGVLSARMAMDGMSASPEVLDHSEGFLRAISPALDVDVTTSPRLGEHWHLLRYGLSIKRYPVCYCAHRTIDAAVDLAERTFTTPDEVEQITVSLSTIHATILKHHRPQSGLEAKFSAEFAAAAALIARNVGLREVSDAFVQRSDVQELMRRVSVVTVDKYDPEAPGFAPYDQVSMRLRSGRVLESQKVTHALGNARRPLSPEDLRKKFFDCVEAGDRNLDAAALFSQLQRLESARSVRELYHAHVGEAHAAADTCAPAALTH